MNPISPPLGRTWRCAAALAAISSLAFAAPAAAVPVSGFTAWRVAGDGTACGGTSCGDSGPATDAGLFSPTGVALDHAGNLYVADVGSHRVRRVSSAGVITTVAGTGQPCPVSTDSCGDGGLAAAAKLNKPAGVAVDGAGNVFIADAFDHRVRKVSASDGRISTVVGTGTPCPAGTLPCGNGGPAKGADLTLPSGVAVDAAGSIYVSETFSHRVRRVTAAGTITAFAGDGNACAAVANCGDGGPADAARLLFPAGVAVGPAGGVLIADFGDKEVRRVAGGQIVTVAGDGTACIPGTCGNGGPATLAQVTPAGVATGPDGSIFVSDSVAHQVRRVSPAGRIALVAGDGTPCAKPPACGDGGSATRAQFNGPGGLALDAVGNVFVADQGDHEVRWLAGPQAGPPGLPGPGGLGGPPGSPGPAGRPGRDARTVVVAYMATASARRVTIRYALTAKATVTLRVTGPGARRPVVVGRRSGRAGLNVISWNRRLARGRKATRGRYRLSVTATVAGRSATSAIRVTLRAT